MYPSLNILRSFNVTFTCSAYATTPFIYIWYKNSQILDHNLPIMTLSNVTADDSATYQCGVRNYFLLKPSEQKLLDVFCKCFYRVFMKLMCFPFFEPNTETPSHPSYLLDAFNHIPFPYRY